MPIVYDNLVNPISYLGNTLSWEKGRQLKQFTKADGTIISYTYNANGIRTSKTVDGVKHTYALDGTKILKETWGDCTLIPLYDNEDSVCGIIYDDAPYYFYKNLQGDILEITDRNGAVVARYTYDAWGRVVAITDSNGVDISDNVGHVANVNPFRYRGYYYDAEIGMYYLQSRYYDPVVGRFINADDIGYLNCMGACNSYGLFIYGNNSPSNAIDSTGYYADKLYSGIVGFGVQILFSANVLCYQGFIGLEALWFAFTKNNNFGNGLIPWLYFFFGGSMGLTLDFDMILSKSFLDNPKNMLKGLGCGFTMSLYFTFFLINANKMSSPDDYTRSFTFDSVTVWGVTISRAVGSNISTYGVGCALEIGAGIKNGISLGKKNYLDMREGDLIIFRCQ